MTDRIINYRITNCREIRWGFAALGLALLFFWSNPAHAQNVVWTNGSGDGQWNSAGNWDTGSTPAAGDLVIFTDGANGGSISDCVAVAGSVVQNLLGLEIRAGYTGTIQFNPLFGGGLSQTLTVSGDIKIENGTLILASDATNSAGTVLIAANFSLSGAGTVHANGLGFAGNNGPGASVANGQGGTHAGSGATNASGAYGSPTAPVTLGSGGFDGPGGGAVTINTATGTITINGTLQANGEDAPNVGWLEDFANRKRHTLTGSSGAGSGYQLALTVHFGSGTDAADQIFLNGKCQNDFRDVRFADASGAVALDYWMQSKTDGDQAVFWIKVNSNLDSNQDIFVYYGNSGVTNASSGDRTFLFFDDASGTYSDKWVTIAGSAGYGTTNGRPSIDLSSATTNIRTKDFQHSGPMAIEMDLYATSLITGIQYYQDSTPVTNERYHARIDVRSGQREQIIRSSGQFTALDSFSSVNTWVSTILTRDQNANHNWTVGGVLSCTRTNDSTFTSGYLALNHHNSGTGAAANIRVRKFVSPEPGHGSFGSEEDRSTATAGVDAGAGGSIQLICGTLEGNGTLESRGGNGGPSGAGGGGGRIALNYNTTTFTGSTGVTGGTGGLNQGSSGSVTPASLTVADHSGGQASNIFAAPGNYSNVLLLRFRLSTGGNALDAAFEDIQISRLIFSLSSITGVAAGDWPSADIRIFSDNDGDGVVSTGDTNLTTTNAAIAITGGSGTVTLDFGGGVFVIDDTRMGAGGVQDFLLQASINNIVSGDEFTLGLTATEAFVQASGAVLAAPVTVANATSTVGFAELSGAVGSLRHGSTGAVPVANADSFSLLQGLPYTQVAPGVLSNDTDADGDTLNATLSSGPVNGTLLLNPNGSFTYTPAAGFTGTDSFSYVANDGLNTSTPATVTFFILPSLIANASATPNPIVVGEKVTLSSQPAGGSGTYVSYVWTGPDNFQASTQNPGSVVFDQTGFFTYTLTVTDSAGFSATESISVAVLGSALIPNASASPNLIALGESASLSSSPTGGSGVYVGFQWTGPNGFSSTLQNPGIVTPGIPGSHTYTLTVTDASGLTATASVPVLVGEILPGIQVGSGGVRYRVSTASSSGVPLDFFKIVLEGVDLNRGDRLALNFNGIEIGDLSVRDGLILDEKLRANGQLGSGVHRFNRCRVRYKQKRRRLVFTASKGAAALNGRPMVQAVSGVSQPVRVSILVDRAPGDGKVDMAFVLPIQFKVKTRTNAAGVLVESGRSK